MTRETYIKVARAVNKQLRRNYNDRTKRRAVIGQAVAFAALARVDNPRFAVGKFVDACCAGVPKTPATK